MKNFLIIIIFIIFIIPISSAYSQEDKLDIAITEIPFEELEYIEELGDPHASAYVTIRNSNGDLIGVSHVHASRYLEHPIVPMFLDYHETIETFTIENMKFGKPNNRDFLLKSQELLNFAPFCASFERIPGACFVNFRVLWPNP